MNYFLIFLQHKPQTSKGSSSIYVENYNKCTTIIQKNKIHHENKFKNRSFLLFFLLHRA